jgi:hypothetical protein
VNLSNHFTLDEFTTSQNAARLGLDNNPPPEVIERLKRTALGLEMVRALLGAPIHINSGYRSPVVNRAVGGVANSQHVTGEAADIICPGFGTPAEVVRAIVASKGIPFDQCILEFNSWCHISFTDNGPRRQALVIDHSGTRAFA